MPPENTENNSFRFLKRLLYNPCFRNAKACHSRDTLYKPYKLYKLLTNIFFYFSILFFIIGFNFSDVMVGNWYQQFMPNLHGAIILDIKFTDSLTGYAITNLDSFNTARILRTTNSGDNWAIIRTQNQTHKCMKFINANTGFVDCFVNSNASLIKTTNGGANWTTIYVSEGFVNDIALFNEDTIWAANPMPAEGGIYRTTNGGTSWERIYWTGGFNPEPEKLYMYNRNIGFMVISMSLYKTTNGGFNWTGIPGGAWTDIYFIDSLIGWKADPTPPANMKKTTDGGLNWVNQTLPNGGIIITSNIYKFCVLNQDTIFWGGASFLRKW